MAAKNTTINPTTENTSTSALPTSTSAFPTSTATPPTTPNLSPETILIIAAAVPSGVAFILAIALITVIGCWCCSCRRAKEKKKKRGPSLAIGIETLEEARTRSLRESQANRLQLLQDGAIQLGHTNPLDVQHDEYYQNSEVILNQRGLREQEQGDEDSVDVATKETTPLSDDDDDYENVEPNSQVSAPVRGQTQRPVLRPVRQQSDDSDDDKDEHDYVNVPKEGKPNINPKAAVLARVAHLMDK